MRLNLGFIRSKVTRRVVWLFFLSALVPITAMAVFSFTYINDLLVEQAYRQLQHAGKLYGMSVLDRLLIIDDKLRILSENLNNTHTHGQDFDLSTTASDRTLGHRHDYDKQIVKLTFEIIPDTSVYTERDDPNSTVKTMLYSKTDGKGNAKIYLRHIVSVLKNHNIATLVAEVNSRFLWGDKDSLPFSSFLCVVEESGTVLFCPHPDRNAFLTKLSKFSEQTESKKLKWTSSEGENLAVAWVLFTKSRFAGQNWKIFTSSPEADALLPLYAFRNFFPGIILFSILVVLLLSMIQVRRSMQPLKQLVTATRRLANYEFGEPVNVKSEDEFKELAESFNIMAVRLKKQFIELKILSEIDHLILTNPDLDVVLARIFDSAKHIIPCDFIAITLPDKTDERVGSVYIKEVAGNKPPHMQKTTIPVGEAENLNNVEDGLLVNLETQTWHILEPLKQHNVVTAQICPIRIDNRLRAIFSLGYRKDSIGEMDEARSARGIIDRLAVALATADRNEKLYHQAHFDDLTGLPNRQLFNDRLEQYIIQAQRKNQRAAVLYIDLDRFKNINDSLGHPSGDNLLQQVAERLRKYVRATDTISRLGGDEFVIVLTNISSPKDVANIAHNIIDAICQPFFILAREIFINLSIGVAMYPEDGKNTKELLAHADAALYHAKESGRGRYMFFEESMNREIVQRIEMETAMRHALARKEFTLYYHPQVDMRSGKIVGVEALIRWHHPELGLVLPDRFITLAEDCGLIEPIGEWVLHTACAQFQDWRSRNIAPTRLAVNISSRQFMQTNFVDIINKAITSSGMHPGELELEITESLLMDERINTKSIFSELAGMGVKLAIDDFGTGYSSLSYLKRFSVHTLKIDRTFIRDIPADRQATTLTLSIIAMAHALNMDVVAEGVETKEQLDVLQANNCNFIQGYYFSKPLPAEKLELLLTQYTSKVSCND